MGVSSPSGEYKDNVLDMLTCVCSIQFSQDYINASQYSEFPLLDNESLRQNFLTVGNVIYNYSAQ